MKCWQFLQNRVHPSLLRHPSTVNCKVHDNETLLLSPATLSVPDGVLDTEMEIDETSITPSSVMHYLMATDDINLDEVMTSTFKNVEETTTLKLSLEKCSVQ